MTGADLNRSWNRISKWINPSLHEAKSLLECLDKNNKTPLDCVLDLHAHTNATGVFIYGNTYDDVYRCDITTFPYIRKKISRIAMIHS